MGIEYFVAQIKQIVSDNINKEIVQIPWSTFGPNGPVGFEFLSACHTGYIYASQNCNPSTDYSLQGDCTKEIWCNKLFFQEAFLSCQ